MLLLFDVILNLTHLQHNARQLDRLDNKTIISRNLQAKGKSSS